MHIEDSSRDLI